MLRDPFDLNKLGQIDTSMIIFQYYFFTNTQFKVSQLKHMNKKDVGQQKKKKKTTKTKFVIRGRFGQD